MTPTSVAHDAFVIERTYSAPVKVVFEAWADPVLKARLFTGSADTVPEQRIVHTYEMYADAARISVSVATVEFQRVGAATRLVLTDEGAFLDGHDTAAQREEGTRSFLESLAERLSEDA